MAVLPDHSRTRRLGRDSRGEQAKRVLLTALLAGAVAVLFVIVWQTAQILLLLFAGLLFSIFLRGLAAFLCRHTPLSTGWSLALVVCSLLAAVLLVGWLYGPALADGLTQLFQRLPSSLDRLRSQMSHLPGASALFDSLQRAADTLRKPEVLSRIAGVFSSALGAMGSLLVVVFMGLYFSVEPGIYRRGLLKLVPPEHRDRASEVLNRLGQAEWSWLLGRIASMTVVGVLTWLGLLLIGLPFSFILGLVAGALSFIPNLGPTLSAIPGVLVGLSESGSVALYVIVVYVAVQTLESYLITPFIQQRMISLPPAMLLAVQLLMGVGFGILGLLLATPLAVVVMTLVQDLYLGEPTSDNENHLKPNPTAPES